MKLSHLKQVLVWLGVVSAVLCLHNASANDRLFTYSYEPETMPQGAREFEQWVTLRSQRTKDGTVKKQNFNRWELRQELEYGVTDNYTVGLYLNSRSDSFRDFSKTPAADTSKFEFRGVSFENRYMLLNPAEHPVGLTFYLEPGFSGDGAEVEQKIILGQRHGDWKWAVNLVHETEWEHNFHETVGEVEGTFGIARHLGKRWALGVEMRHHSKLPEYRRWDNSALFFGPVVSYRQEKWWAALTVLPQIYGWNYHGNPDAHSRLELTSHERVNIRFIFGIDF